MAPPQHTVTVEVFSQETGAPLAGAEVRLGPYRAMTTAAGTAVLRVARGRYPLVTWKIGFEAPATFVDVVDNVTVRVNSATVVEENVDRAWRA